MPTPQTKKDVLDKIFNYFDEEFGLTAQDMNAETDVFELNLLDSMEVLKIIVFVDDTFGIQTQIYEVSLENFSTANNIADYVLAQLGKSA